MLAITLTRGPIIIIIIDIIINSLVLCFSPPSLLSLFILFILLKFEAKNAFHFIIIFLFLYWERKLDNQRQFGCIYWDTKESRMRYYKPSEQ